MIKADKRKIDLSIVDVNDEDSRTFFPLIEQPVGSVTYEHCVVEKLYGNVYIGAAERNYYVDRYHELCLCAYYNKRVPGKYEFIPEYQFFITKKRMCLDTYWNLGNVSDESMILQQYTGLEEAVASPYYEDFYELKKKIEEGITWKKEHVRDPFEYGLMTRFQWVKDERENEQFTVYECVDPDQRLFVQFYYNNETEKWELMSISKEELSDLMRFLKDFDKMDKEELHLRSFLPIDKNADEQGARYHDLFKCVKESYERFNNTEYM